MVMRQSKYKDEAFLEKKINWNERCRPELINKSKESITSDHMEILMYSILSDSKATLIRTYTLGEPIESISDYAHRFIEDAISYIKKTDNDLSPDKILQQYIDCLHLLAFCYYFDASKEEVYIIADNNPFTGNDRLTDFLIKASIPEHKITSRNLAFPDIYQPLMDAIDLLHEPDTYKEKMNQFLEGYYPGLGKHHVTWYDSHKEKNPDYCIYTGYWIFELPALLLSTNIFDDSPFRDHPFYPKDLADWKREQIKQEWENTRSDLPPDSGG